MKSPAVRITLAAVIIALITAFSLPLVAYADDATGTGTVATETVVSVETSASTDPGGTEDGVPLAAGDAASSDVDTIGPDSDGASTASAGSAPVQYSSQSTSSTHDAIEAMLRARKKQYDRVTAELKRTIDRLAADIRAEEAQGGSVAPAKIQLARARAALQRAYALERAVTVKYRAVVTADDQRAQYEKAKQAARSSTAQLLTVTKLLKPLVSTARLVAVLQPLRAGVDIA